MDTDRTERSKAEEAGGGARTPPSAATRDRSLGVYVHLPYCERICPYCDFAVIAARKLDPQVEDRYVEGVLRELLDRVADFPGRRVETIYFGGGTPALFRPASIERIRKTVCDVFSTEPSSVVETTLELNPSTLERDRLPAFLDAGVDRLSVGVQSFDDGLLKRLGRAHRSPVIDSTLDAARRAGFANLSLDLIFAGPDQTPADLARDLDRMLGWDPEHISTYELTFEPDTPFGRALAAGRMEAIDEDRAADMIEAIESRLTASGWLRYEISNYARPGKEARHNARYWQRQPVLGLGLGAHSTEAPSQRAPFGARRANPRRLEDWLDGTAEGPGTRFEEEILDAGTARGEAVFLALRRRAGLDAQGFEREFGAPPRAFFDGAIERWRAAGCLEEAKTGDLRLTRAGRLVADSVAASFVGEAVSRP